jgi:hypothetical protein
MPTDLINIKKDTTKSSIRDFVLKALVMKLYLDLRPKKDRAKAAPDSKRSGAGIGIEGIGIVGIPIPNSERSFNVAKTVKASREASIAPISSAFVLAVLDMSLKKRDSSSLNA